MKLKKMAAGLMAGIMLLGVLSTTCLAAETDASAEENPAVLTEADAATNATEAARIPRRPRQNRFLRQHLLMRLTMRFHLPRMAT